MKNYPTEITPIGNIRYNDEVLRTMVNLALSEIEGVVGTEARGTGGLLGRKNLSHITGINVQEQRINIDLAIIVKYGLPLREKAREVQQKVGATISSMTGLEVDSVNVVVAGLELDE